MKRSLIWKRILTAIALAAVCQIANAATPPVVISADTKWSELNPTPDNTTVVITGGAILTVDVPNATCRGITVGNDSGVGTLKISTSAQVIIAGPVTVGATVSSGTINMTLGGVLELQRFDVGTPANATLVPGAGTIRFTSLPNFTLPQSFGSYHNIEFASNATATLPATNVDIDGTLFLTSGRLDNASNMLRMVSASAIVRSKGTLLSSPPEFLGFADVTYQQSGTLTTGLELPTSPTALRNLTIQNNSASLVIIPPGSTITVNGNMTMSAGNFSINGSSISVRGNFTNSDSSPAFDATNGTVTFDGSAHQVIGGPIEITFNNLTFKNSAGVSMSQNVTVNGTLGLDTGLVTTTGTRVLTVGPNGSAVRGTGWIFGTEAKLFPVGTTASFVYDIGEELSYWPLTSLNTTATVAGTIAAKVTPGDHPAIAASGLDGTRSVNRFWTLTKTNFVGTTDLQFDNTDRDVIADPLKFQVHRRSGIWNGTSPAVSTLTTTSVSGISAFGDFAIGEQFSHHFAVTPASLAQTAGVSFSVTVEEQDIINLVVLASANSPLMTSSTTHVQFPAVTLVSGAATVSVVDNVAETVTLTATLNSITGTSAPVVVSPATADHIVITLPGQTFVPGFGNTGAQHNQFEDVPFNLVALTITDVFNNVVPTSGARALAYSGPSSAEGAPVYANPVNFLNGRSTTTLTTTLTTVEDNVSITVADDSLPFPFTSDAFDVLFNIPPVVTILGIPESAVNEGATISMSARVIDPDEFATFTYAWTITAHNNPGVYTITGSANIFVFVPPDNGTYDVSLFVQNNHNGSDTANASLSALNVAPVAAIAIPHDKHPVGKPLSASAIVTDPGSADTFAYAWAISRNGSPFNPGVPVTESTIVFTPTLTGSYVITLTVTDDDGGVSNIASKAVTVGNFPPTVAITGSTAARSEGASISFSTNVTNPSNDLTALSYTWTVTKDSQPFDPQSATTNPAFSFVATDNGSYVVSVVVSDPFAGSANDSKTITITNVTPVVQIVGAPPRSPEGSPITFSSTVTDASILDTFVFQWSVTKNSAPFDSGTVSTSADFLFTPDDNGTFVVSLRVDDDDAGTTTVSKTIIVDNVPPNVTIDGPAKGLEGSPIAFTSTVSDAGVLDTFTYSWRVTKNGNPFNSSSVSTSATFEFTPDDNGSYTVTLTVTDNAGGTTIATANVAIDNVSPTASIEGAPQNAPEGVPITLTSTATDPAGPRDTFSYQWSVTKNVAPYQTGTVSTSATFSFTPDDNGLFEVLLSISDEDGGLSNASAVSIAVNNVAPAVSFAGPDQGIEGTAISLTSSVQDVLADIPSLQYAWLASSPGIPNLVSSSANFTFVPPDNGSFLIRLDVTDKDGGVSSSTKVIAVDNAPPVAQISGAPAQSPEGSLISLTSIVTDPGSRDTFIYLWSITKDSTPFNSGTVSTSANFAFTPDDNATFVVSLQVNDDNGGTTTVSKTITVDNVPPNVSINGPATGLVTFPITLTGIVSDPGRLDAFTFKWTVAKAGVPFDSGTVSTSASFTFTPDANETYQVMLTVRDKDGASVSVSTTVDVLSVAINETPIHPLEGAPLTFTSTVSGPAGANPILTYKWYAYRFGIITPPGVVTGSATSFSFTPSDDGFYFVDLTVSDAYGGKTETFVEFTVDNVPPTPTITGAPANRLEGQQIALGSSVTDPAGALDPISYNWSVSRNGTTIIPSPVTTSATYRFTPPDSGNYVVTLQVSDDEGGVSTAAVAIRVDNVAPVPFIQDAPLFVDEGTPVTLSCVVDDPAFDVDQITYSWTVTKDGDAYGVVGKQNTYTFTPDDDGTYEVTLTVRDKDVGIGTDSVQIAVFNLPPAATAGSDQVVAEGQRVFLSGDFTDPGTADTHTFSWSVSATNGEVVPGGTNRNFSFTPQDDGTYTVAFRVEDDDGDFATASVQITVANAAPSAEFTNSGPAKEGDTVTVSFANLTDPSTRDVAAGFQYRFDFDNDGTFDLTSATSTAQVPAILIDGGSQPRRIIVAGEISDKDGGKAQYTTEIVISNVAPIAICTKGDPANEAFLGAVSVTGVADPSQADVLAGFTYSFDFNNDGDFNDLEEISGGTQATVAVPVRYRTTNPNHIVHTRVTDKDGGSVEFRLQQPQFASAVLSASATASLPFIYTLSATGRPDTIVYTAVGSNPNSGVNSLEDIGLEFDGTKITGTPTRVGQLTIQMTAQNSAGLGRASLILTIGGEPNSVPPEIVSGPTATPARSTVNVPIAFSAVGTDLDGNMISYSWNFGDGSSSKEQNPAHAYAAAGNFTVVLTVSDGKKSTSKDIFVTVSSGPDVPFEISKMTVAFNFKTPGKHALSLTGKATLPNNVVFAGTQFEFIATGSHYRRLFEIDGKGKAGTSVLKFAVGTKSTTYSTLPKPTDDLSVRQFTLSDKSVTLFDELASLGFVNATTSADVVVPMSLRINSRYLQASVTLKYKAVAGKSGSGKK